MLDDEILSAPLQRGAVRDKMPYGEVRDFVIGYANDRESHRQKNNIAGLDQESSGQEGWWNWNQRGEEWYPVYTDVDGIFKGKCYGCGEDGHMSKNCPKKNGKGGFKGSPKGGQKGQFGSWNFGSKGGQKGQF